MDFRYRIYLTNGGKAFGKGPHDLLSAVSVHGSLNKAAESLGMSYSKAWRLVKMAEARLGFPLMRREVGGAGGGGSYLTPEAERFMERYRAFLHDADRELTRLFQLHFGEGE